MSGAAGAQLVPLRGIWEWRTATSRAAISFQLHPELPLQWAIFATALPGRHHVERREDKEQDKEQDVGCWKDLLHSPKKSFTEHRDSTPLKG